MVLTGETAVTVRSVREKELILLSGVTSVAATKYIRVSFTLDIDTNENMLALT